MLIQAIDVPLNNIPVFGISSYHGFLPADDPLRELPGQFTAWEEVADALPILIIAGRLQRAIEVLLILSAGTIDDPLSILRAMMLLCLGRTAGRFRNSKNIVVPSFHVVTQVGLPLVRPRLRPVQRRCLRRSTPRLSLKSHPYVRPITVSDPHRTASRTA